MKNNESMESFRRAFDSGIGALRGTCECGREFMDADGEYDWEDGEREDLENNPNVVKLDHSVTFVSFGGSEYVYDCDCWHGIAAPVIRFLNSHAVKIADYLNFEQARKISEANKVPKVRV